jgi:DNA polymerase-2
MIERTGWLLDLYDHPRDGVVLWLLDEQGRHRLTQALPVTFYAAGPAPRLRALWRYLQNQPRPVQLSRQERRDLFAPGLLPVLAAQVELPSDQPGLFRLVSQAFPELTYYDADLPLTLRHAARFGTFPLARCRVQADESGRVQELEVLDSPWQLDLPDPPLSILTLEPNVDPFHALPSHLLIRTQRASYRLALEPVRPLLINLRAILLRHDPDLILTNWGDTWLLDHLLTCARQQRLPLPLNREPGRGVLRKAERSYFTYGQIIHRGQQVHLFGRWHVDGCNAMLFGEYGLDGIYELARVTSLSIQTVARVSPGTGISSMQMVTALRTGVLVPWHKQQAERPKTAYDLLQADQGGLVYQPVIGLHRHVAAIDFMSMYPSIMARFNVSPETVGSERPTAQLVPELGVMVAGGEPGLVPQTLQPLLDKRLALKRGLNDLPAWDPRRKTYKAQATAHKWLLVTCFGYLGYKNARFGRIEAHEAVTAYGREALLRAKEAAEDLGYTVLHMYVDGLWVQKPGATRPADLQPLLEEVVARTGLPIALDGIYRWVAFLPSRQNEQVPVPNRYFGLFEDGSFKLRGIEARRRDTPAFIVETQMQILEHMARTADPAAGLPAVQVLLRRKLAALRAGQIPIEKLLVTQKLSRELAEYRVPSPPARAAAQLEAVGKSLRAGQNVRLIYTADEIGVRAWDAGPLPERLNVDRKHYAELLLRAAETLLLPLGVEPDRLRDWLFCNAAYGCRPGYLPARPASYALPLWSGSRQQPNLTSFLL